MSSEQAPWTTRTRVCLLLHVYYLELLPQLIDHIRLFPDNVAILASSPSQHVPALEKTLRSAKPSATILCRGVPNVGQDIAPMLVEYRDELLKYELVCKLHTKKSQHQGGAGTWREFLLRNLVGTTAVVQKTISLFERNPKLGVVFPSAYVELKAWMGWSPATFQLVRQLFAGIRMDPFCVPDFPTGSMYWFNPRALSPLFEPGWQWKDFSVGRGDEKSGSLSHGLERTILATTHHAGYTWLKLNRAGGERNADMPFVQKGGAGIAAVVHLHSLDGIMGLIAGLKNLAFRFDLIVTISADIAAAVNDVLTQHFEASRVTIIPVENRGYDIGPLFSIADLVSKYSLVCKLHQKHRSPDWNRYLLENMVGGVAEVNCILAMFARDEGLGIVYSRTFAALEKHIAWGSNYACAKRLAQVAGLPDPDLDITEMAAGSMFWFRPKALASLLNSIKPEQFEVSERSILDGTHAHAVERLFLFAARATGFRTRDVLFHPYRGDQKQQLY